MCKTPTITIGNTKLGFINRLQRVASFCSYLEDMDILQNLQLEVEEEIEEEDKQLLQMCLVE